MFTDEQVALKKKEKEASEKWNNPWKKSESDKIVWEKILDQSKVRVSKPSIYGIKDILLAFLNSKLCSYHKVYFKGILTFF